MKINANLIAGLDPGTKLPMPPDEIMPIVNLLEELTELKLEDCYKTRKREIVMFRQYVWLGAHQVFGTKYSLAKMGSWFGKDHATVLHALRQLSDLCDVDAEIKADTQKFLNRMYDMLNSKGEIYKKNLDVKFYSRKSLFFKKEERK